MIKSLKRVLEEEKSTLKIPNSVQEALPVDRIYKDGIFKSGKKYTKTFCFEDINYAVASKEDKQVMFLNYSELLNSLDTNSIAKITINNRKLNKEEFEKRVLLKLQGDKLDIYRQEYNDMLLDRAEESNGIIQEKYITISTVKKNIQEARIFFKRISGDLTNSFKQLGSSTKELTIEERLQILHDFYNSDDENNLHFNLTDNMKKGHSFKDLICPNDMTFEHDYFKVGDKYGRVIYLKEYANFIKDSMIAELCDFSRNMMLSIDIISTPTDEAVKELENIVLGVETNITNWQRRQNANNNFTAIIPYDMELQRKESREFLDDITTRDQRMMFGCITIVHLADTKEDLDNDTENLLATARKYLCQFAPFKLESQQLAGLQTVLPIGVFKVNVLRTLLTESIAVFMPFRVQEINDKGGIFFGQNAISNNLLLCNKEKLVNANSFLLGVPGSGKSFNAKEQIAFLALATNDDILICDPEEEYTPMVTELGGAVINISAGSSDHINAMDMVEGYGDNKNPIVDKSEFILSLFEQLDEDGLGAKEKSIIDRCTTITYEQCKANGKVPTLFVLKKILEKQPEPEAKGLALKLELFTSGNLDAFAHPTNVDIKNRIISYNIHDLGKQLKTMGLLVITDAMINKVTQNWKKGIRTHIFLDEIHVVFDNPYSASFFNSAWRQFRKRDAYPTGITQNVEYLLDSVLASTMLSNSEFIVMLNQATSDRDNLARLLNISPQQMSYITNSEPGNGLIRYGKSLVPFVNHFPKNTKLYKLMTTKPGE